MKYKTQQINLQKTGHPLLIIFIYKLTLTKGRIIQHKAAYMFKGIQCTGNLTGSDKSCHPFSNNQ